MYKCHHKLCGFIFHDEYSTEPPDEDGCIECPKCGGEASDYDVDHIYEMMKEMKREANNDE